MTDSGTMTFWQQLWQGSKTPWDLGQPHPALPRLLQKAHEYGNLLEKVNFIVPGCGSGFDAAYLAQQGHQVTGIDFVPEAIAKASELHQQQPNIQWLATDFFTHHPRSEVTYQGFFDRAMLCALPPNQHRRYAKHVADLCESGAVFLGIFFEEVDHGNQDAPPFATPVSHLTDLFDEEFTLAWAESLPTSDSPIQVGSEILTVWIKQ